MPSSRWRLSAESVTAAAAVVTAFVALAVGVWQTAEARRHNRLSVRPLLDFTTSVALSHPDSAAVAFEVTNRGLGLAGIDQMTIRVQTRSGGEEAYATWTPAIPAIQAFGVLVGSRSDLPSGMLVEPGQTVTLLELRSEGRIPIDSLLGVVQRIDAEVAYRSLYEESFTGSVQG